MERSLLNLFAHRLTAARMTAVAGNFRHVLFFRIFAMLAAILLIVADRAAADIVPACVIFVCHDQNLPCSIFSPAEAGF